MREGQLLVPSPDGTIGWPRARRDAGRAAARDSRRFFPTNARRRQRERDRDSSRLLSCSYYGDEGTLIVARK